MAQEHDSDVATYYLPRKSLVAFPLVDAGGSDWVDSSCSLAVGWRRFCCCCLEVVATPPASELELEFSVICVRTSRMLIKFASARAVLTSVMVEILSAETVLLEMSVVPASSSSSSSSSPLSSDSKTSLLRWRSFSTLRLPIYWVNIEG